MKKIIGVITAVVQKLFVNVALLFIYIIGFGVTYILAAVFKKRMLWNSRNTGWRLSSEDNAGVENYDRES